jgi:hypothetical protein
MERSREVGDWVGLKTWRTETKPTNQNIIILTFLPLHTVASKSLVCAAGFVLQRRASEWQVFRGLPFSLSQNLTRERLRERVRVDTGRVREKKKTKRGEKKRRLGVHCDQDEPSVGGLSRSVQSSPFHSRREKTWRMEMCWSGTKEGGSRNLAHDPPYKSVDPPPPQRMDTHP